MRLGDSLPQGCYLRPMRRLALAAMLCLAAVPAAGQSAPTIYLSDVLHRPSYRSAYDAMIRGRRDLPAFVASVRGIEDTADMPGALVTIHGQRRELYHVCQTHHCGDRDLVVLFEETGTGKATGLLRLNNKRTYLGNPDKAEVQTLDAELP